MNPFTTIIFLCQLLSSYVLWIRHFGLGSGSLHVEPVLREVFGLSLELIDRDGFFALVFIPEECDQSLQRIIESWVAFPLPGEVFIAVREEEARPLFKLFAVHHRVDGRALHRSVAQDIHDVCGRSAALDNVMPAVVPEAVGVHVRHLCSVAVPSQHFPHPLDGEPVAALHAGH